MVDPSLKGTYPIKSLSRFADIISSCIMVKVLATFGLFQANVNIWFYLLMFSGNRLAERARISTPDLGNCTGTLTNGVEERQELKWVEDPTKCSWCTKMFEEACF